MEIKAIFEPNVKQPIGYVYITYDISNHRYYCGKHKSNVFDTTYYGSGKLMQQALRMYPASNFICVPIDWAGSVEELAQKEMYWIQHYNATTDVRWYNLADGNLVHRQPCITPKHVMYEVPDIYQIKQMIQDWYAQNKQMFVPDTNVPAEPHWGFVTSNYVAVYPRIFDELIRSWGFHVNTVKKQLQTDGFIQKSSGKNLNKQHTLKDGTTIRLVKIHAEYLN